MGSRLCTFNDFRTLGFRDYCIAAGELFNLHRKSWEHYAIFDALRSADKLQADRSGIGWGVGPEKLPSVFAARGVNVYATDQLPSEQTQPWSDSGLAILNQYGLCPSDEFARRVTFGYADMNEPASWGDVGGRVRGYYDFCWSSCALDHLGTIEKGLQFILNSLDVLRPGGMAAHTTEYNVSSDNATLDSSGVVFFRRRDMAALEERVKAHGCTMQPFDPNKGNTQIDKFVDRHPYTNDCHLKLKSSGYVVTSVIVIISKDANSG